jgi:hypothetical protein
MQKKVCIFCQESGKLTKEHFWPEWFRPYVGTNESDKYLSEVHGGEGKNPAVVEKSNERPGNLITLKFRVVCQKCNNGWMSELERQVKDFFASVIGSEKVYIDEQLQNLLSKWIVMKVLVSEQSEEGTQVTPKEDIKSFYDNGRIPEYFRVYLGKHDTENKSDYMRCSYTFSLSDKGPIEPMYGLQRNTQTIAFLLGPVFIYVIACRETSLRIWQKFRLNEVISI